MASIALVTVLALIGSDQQPPVFASGTQMVRVVVNVTDAAGRPARDLSAADFKVKEDGKTRSITTFARATDTVAASGPASVEVVLLLDTSFSMRPRVRRARNAAVEFLKTVPNVTSRSVVSFDGDVLARRYDDADPARLLDEVVDRNPNLGSRLFDGIQSAANRFELEEARRAVVVITDGSDENSKIDRAAAIRALQDASATFYAISFASTLGDAAKDAARDLREIATATGGLVTEGTSDDLINQFLRIRDDIASQYVIGFEPAASTGGRRHALKIETSRKGLTIRHRREYETPRDATAR
jgi:Ca-activated chloride channel homolog